MKYTDGTACANARLWESALLTVMLSYSDIFSCKYSIRLSFKLFINNNTFYLYVSLFVLNTCVRLLRCPLRRTLRLALSSWNYRYVEYTWKAFSVLRLFFTSMNIVPGESLVSFAQWQYRNQWGSAEVRLLLVENFYQYPAMTMWNTIGYGNFWKFLRKLIIELKNKKFHRNLLFLHHSLIKTWLLFLSWLKIVILFIILFKI